MRRVSINGNITENDAKVSVFDAGFYFGLGIYETLSVQRKTPVFLEEHIARMKNGIAFFDFPFDENTEKTLRTQIDQILKDTRDSTTYRLRIMITPGELSLTAARITDLTVVLYLSDYELDYKKEYTYFIPEVRRNVDSSLPAYVKITSGNKNLLSALQARQHGADESLLLNQAGFVTEGSFSNIFFIRGNKIFTPAIENNLLAGITRSKVIECARTLNFEVEEGSYTPDDIHRSEDVFLSSSTRGPGHVHRILSYNQKEMLFARSRQFSSIQKAYIQMLEDYIDTRSRK